MKLILLGKSRTVVRTIQAADPAVEIIVIDQPQYVDDHRPNSKNKIPFITYETQIDLAKISDQLCDASAVIPVFERTVADANYLAKCLSLPRINDIGATIFRDKYKLRDFCKPLGINQPAYTLIHSADDLHKVFNGKPLVFKPVALAGSMGVVKITNDSQIDTEYKFTQCEIQKDGTSIPLGIAEEFITGSEFSCEYIVQNGHVLFRNVTKKFKFQNGHFVESGHLVPGIINQKVLREIYDALDRLVDAAKIGTAVLHSEWLVTPDNSPYLVEIAGRRPGDRIADLITLAYGFDFLWQYCRTMAGQTGAFDYIPNAFAEQRYFNFHPGRVTQISGLEALEGLRYELSAKVGDVLPPITSSNERVGYVIQTNSDFYELEREVQTTLKSVSILTETNKNRSW